MEEIRYSMKWGELKKLCKSTGIPKCKLSISLKKSKDYLSNLSKNDYFLDYESIKYIAQRLKCRISDIANIPSEKDRDYTEVVKVYETIDDICPLPFALNCSEMLSPVEIVKALPNVVDFKHWHKLEESPNPHIELRKDGNVIQRYENGNAILFTNEYIKPDELATEMEKIRKWGVE